MNAPIIGPSTLTILYPFEARASNVTATACEHDLAMADTHTNSRIVVPERSSPDWDRAVGLMGLEAQVQLLPYALGFFGICLPVVLIVAGHATNAAWFATSLVLYAFNWAIFYAVLRWRKANPPTLENSRLHTGVHVAAGLLWAMALLQTSLFAQAAGPVAETLLVLCAGGAVGVIFFSSPNLPSLLIVGPAVGVGPILALQAHPMAATTGVLVLCALALAMALALILNAHLRSHFALAIEREGLLIEREGALETTRRLAKSKSDILATLSHEIRNGLAGIAHVLAGAMGGGTRNQPSRDQLQAALSAARDLVGVLDATLDSEVAESGRLTVQKVPVDATSMARDIALLHRGSATSKGIELAVEIDPALAGLSGAPVGDTVRVRQVLSNLVGNAVKYTQRGRIEIRVFRPDHDHLRVEVADTGPGLSPEELTLAFQPFERVERTGGGVAGAGIGLTLSRRLAELMGGRLGAESTPGLGSRFWLDLIWDATATLQVEPHEAVSPAPTSLRILVAEDDPLNAAMLRTMLEQMGHKVLAVTDGRRGLDHLRMGQLDLIMADGRMPGMDGPDMIRTLRAQPGTQASLPVIAVTGGDAEEVQAMLDAGADVALRKPITVSALARALADADQARSSRNPRRDVA